MSQPHILLIGAHGKVALKMIPLFLERSWSVTAIIRDSDQETLKTQKNAILATKSKFGSSVTNPGHLDILVHSLSDIKTSKDAASVLDKAKGVNWIVWAAGSGGKGNSPEEKKAGTQAIDGTAAIAFAHAATHNKSIKRYLTISATNARRNQPSWWSDEEYASIQTANKEYGMLTYVEEKTKADECLTVWGNERVKSDEAFKYVVLRPGFLTDEVETETVQLGRTTAHGAVPRKVVALTAAKMLEAGAIGWFDLLSGEEDLDSAVERVAKGGDKYTSIEGESEETAKKTAESYAKTF